MGFPPGFTGYVEPTKLLMKLLPDAKRNAKEIEVTYLDLANAHRLVAHDLIQYALEWYHVSTYMRELIYAHIPLL